MRVCSGEGVCTPVPTADQRITHHACHWLKMKAVNESRGKSMVLFILGNEKESDDLALSPKCSWMAIFTVVGVFGPVALSLVDKTLYCSSLYIVIYCM